MIIFEEELVVFQDKSFVMCPKILSESMRPA
jgi:hypothetical protein